MNDVDALVEADERAIATAARNGNPAIADVVNAHSPWAPYHAYWLTLDWSHDPDRVGVADVVTYDETDEDWPVVDGFGALVAAWAADVPVTLDAPVRRVAMTRGGVEVETPLGTVSGRTALVTVSTNVLASGRITFEPALPSWKTAAVEALPLGVHNKIAIRLNDASATLPESQSLTVMTRDRDVPVALYVRPYGYDYVVASTAGRFAAALERCGEAASVEFLVEHLEAVYGSSITGCLTDHVIATTWQGDPWTLGAYLRGPAGPGAPAGGPGASARRSPVLRGRSDVNGCLLHLSRRVPDRSARGGRDRGRAEGATRGRVMTTNHAMHASFRRRRAQTTELEKATPLERRSSFEV